MDRHVFDYLASEVIDDMPGELREFLLRCSVLPELTAERCAAVSGNPAPRNCSRRSSAEACSYRQSTHPSRR